MDDLARERDYYRQQCDDLGMRVLRLQEEQTRARREARRSRTVTRLIREIYQLAAANVSMDDIGQRFLQVITDTLQIDRAALLKQAAAPGHFLAQYMLGYSQATPLSITCPGKPATFLCANSTSKADPLVDCLRAAVGDPYLLWAYQPAAKLALLLSNTVEDQHLRRAFEAEDQEIIEGALNVFIEIIGRKQAEEKINESLLEKEVLLQEIHHRVKNNLQTIISLLHLQANLIQDQKTLEILQDSELRVRSMALVHETLYHADNLARIDLGQYVQQLARYLFDIHNGRARQIRLTIEANDLFLGVNKAVPCGLILNELLSNALKHAFPTGSGGEIGIRLEKTHEQQLSLIISDSGIGLPQHLSPYNTTSLGLQLVNSLVKQLEGTIAFNNATGTQIKILFSIAPC